MKTFLLMMLMGSLINPHCEMMTGTVVNRNGDGHADWSSRFEISEPYTYIAYDRNLEPGTEVISLFVWKSEPDDIIIRKDWIR